MRCRGWQYHYAVGTSVMASLRTADQGSLAYRFRVGSAPWSSSPGAPWMSSPRAFGLRRLLTVVPPGLRYPTRIARLGRRTAEYVPVRAPVRRLVPVRDPITPGTDQSIQRPTRGDEIGPGVGRDDTVDHGVDRRLGDAGEVLRPSQSGGLRCEIGAQRIPRRGREAEALHRDVEIEIIDARAELNRIDDAHGRFDAEGGEILDERHMVRLERRLLDQELDHDVVAGRTHALARLDRAARLVQELRRLAQQRAILSRAVGYRRHERLAEHLVRHLAAVRLEQGELAGVRCALGHHVGVLEHRMGALIRPVHDGLVGPFEIENVDERFAQAGVLEFLAARIDEPTLRARRRVVGQN